MYFSSALTLKINKIYITSKSIGNFNRIYKLLNRVRAQNITYICSMNKIHQILDQINDIYANDIQYIINKDKVDIHINVEYKHVIYPKIDHIWFNNFKISFKPLYNLHMKTVV